jgi:hypothetical protein
VERLILLGIAPRSVVFPFFAFSLVALFFFLLLVIFFPLLVMVIILWNMSSFLRVFPCQYYDYNLERVLPLSNMLRGVGLWLWPVWHIAWC